jgi:hypothetical protein
MQTITMRGKVLDMDKLIAQNSHKRAVGNARMNARGDIIGDHGVVTMAREEIARDYHKTNPKAVKQVPLRNISQEAMVYDSPAQAVAKQKELLAKKRKISDGDSK